MTPAPAPSEMPEERWIWVPFQVDKRFHGYRIDRFLAERLTGYSRTRVQKILAEARVHKNNKPAKPNSRVAASDQVDVAYRRRPEAPLPADSRLPILFEDDHLLMVDKPAGLLSHPTDKVVAHTVLGILRHSRSDLKSVHLLHRLDRETSGVLALAKSARTARLWTAAMTRHEIKKTYVALVRGIAPREGVIDRPIGPQGGKIKVRQWVDVPGAAPASTRYVRLAAEPGEHAGSAAWSAVRAHPLTGRLHQIRVHLASIGHPLLGDPLYTGEGECYAKMLSGELTAEERLAVLGFPRVALHAARLEFRHPATGQPAAIDAPLPADIRRKWAGNSEVRDASFEAK